MDQALYFVSFPYDQTNKSVATMGDSQYYASPGQITPSPFHLLFIYLEFYREPSMQKIVAFLIFN